MLRLPPDYLTRGRGRDEDRDLARGEAIAAAAYGLDQPVVTARFESLAQPPDVHVHRAFLHENVVTPDLIQQLRARVDALGMRHEEVQQPKLGSGDPTDAIAPTVGPVRRALAIRIVGYV